MTRFPAAFSVPGAAGRAELPRGRSQAEPQHQQVVLVGCRAGGQPRVTPLPVPAPASAACPEGPGMESTVVPVVRCRALLSSLVAQLFLQPRFSLGT